MGEEIKKTILNRSITSKDVAKLAGVSQSTVSRAFSSADGVGVKKEIREKVFKAAKELGYRPNLVARGMISGKTNMIGLVVGDNLGPFYNRIVDMFVEKVQEKGKQCLVFKIPRQEQITAIIERVIQFRLEGVIITASAMNRVMAETIIQNDIPVVLFNRFIPGVDVNMVYVDPVEGGKLVAEYLYKKGHRNIGYVQFDRETSEEMEKKIGFYSQLRQYHIYNLKEEQSEYSYESGYEAGVRILKSEDRPTAIFCTSDLVALGVMDAAREVYNLEIPKDLAVVGYDDIEMASWKAYQLTTVHQPVELLIEKTVQIITEKIENPSGKAVVDMVIPHLVIRHSA